MANEQKPNPATSEESNISKAQSQQQPAAQAGQQAETGEQAGAEQTGDQAATGQAQPGAGPDEGLQGETTTQRHSDIEGASLQPEEKDETGFVGSKGERDTSSELVEDKDLDEDYTPEGK